LFNVGKACAFELINPQRLNYLSDACVLDSNSLSALKEGIVERLANAPELIDAPTFFAFAEQTVDHLTSDEALGLLDFAVSRFETHIASDYGDGPWAAWLNVPGDIPGAVSGLIWSALGSPDSSTRWQAAHCVRRLAQNQCSTEIAALIDWMQKNDVGAFGCSRFPFYKLHARQYLLIALARVALDDPLLLKPHSNVFSDFALCSIPHILIQKFAAETALSIEHAYPNTYTPETRASLGGVGKPTLGVKELGHNESEFRSTALSQRSKAKIGYSIYAFDQYWCEPLGRVFGISADRVQELAAEFAAHEFHVTTDNTYLPDPRQNQWNLLGQRCGRRRENGGKPPV
jgi:hypothetical protein